MSHNLPIHVHSSCENAQLTPLPGALVLLSHSSPSLCSFTTSSPLLPTSHLAHQAAFQECPQQAMGQQTRMDWLLACQRLATSSDANVGPAEMPEIPTAANIGKRGAFHKDGLPSLPTSANGSAAREMAYASTPGTHR